MAANIIETVPLESAEAFVCELLPTTGRLWTKFRAGTTDLPNWIFRGQRESTWGLQPKALRPGAFAHLRPLSDRERTGPHHLQQLNIELAYVLRFAAYLDDLGHHVPGDHPTLRDRRPRNPETVQLVQLPEGFPPTSLLDMFALAQHYGIPTRLLDWSYKPLTAAYFAACEIEKLKAPGAPDLAVWAINRDVIERRLGCETWFKRLDTIVAFVTAPSATNPNLAAQGGMFTLVQPRLGSPLIDLDALVAGAAAEIPDSETPVIYKFTLPASESLRLLRLLNEHRVHAGTIYPGLKGAVLVMEEEGHY